MAPDYNAKFVGNDLFITFHCMKQGVIRVPLAGLCELTNIEYSGQNARVERGNVEIDSSQKGENGESIPLEAIRRFYSPVL